MIRNGNIPSPLANLSLRALPSRRNIRPYMVQPFVPRLVNVTQLTVFAGDGQPFSSCNSRKRNYRFHRKGLPVPRGRQRLALAAAPPAEPVPALPPEVPAVPALLALPFAELGESAESLWLVPGTST